MPVEYLLVPIAFLTSALAGAIGMGGGVLLIAAMPGLVPVAAIFPIHACTQLASNLSRAGFGWRHLQWSMIPPVTLGAVLGAWIGGEVYASLNLHWLPAIVGVLILLLAWMPLPQLPGRGQFSLLALGFYQTGLGMVAGATGPLGAAVLLRRRQQRDWLVVNTAVYMSISHILRVAAFVAIGFSFAPWWHLVVAMVLAVTAGSWVGTLLRGFIPELDFQRAFKVLVTLLALRMIALPFYES
ncbi:sulfite exporter TauE/SafE family protein [Pseudohalioglobus lutimaris]|uniref:Probable membrane transporter protein n=1 Tax=Pseudohalioglobus lutimaris TaxID=1737061 RepID=A0A2N5WXS9_9GAMM|nr:sulfite exporter TauE/SafE family protein [Pseudohalioglobus lutimaris]PLW67025.1 sulfite exporter TauE/SafE family protein [Pseudohalioglobus lutimaris]